MNDYFGSNVGLHRKPTTTLEAEEFERLAEAAPDELEMLRAEEKEMDDAARAEAGRKRDEEEDEKELLMLKQEQQASQNYSA